jgi:hypothetical protein
MKWYMPSWHGDLRLEPADSPLQTRLAVERPTAEERRVVDEIGKACVERGWLKEWKEGWHFGVEASESKRCEFVIGAPVSDLGTLVSGLFKPGPAVLTAIRFEGGKIITTSGGPLELGQALAGKDPAAEPMKEPVAAKDEAKAGSGDAVQGEVVTGKDDGKKKPKPEVAATVRRPTPCCPQCLRGAVGPATEVLLSFLDREQHTSWRDDRTLVVRGGITGNRYLLAHRDSATAARIGRICFDLDEQCIVHFHDLTVPAEEEVLAGMLILQHREPWLRNEATMFDAPSDVLRFKNPFGDIHDGAFDARFMRTIGEFLGLG